MLTPIIVAVTAAVLWSSSVNAYPKETWSIRDLKSIVTFGDSYTDEQRISYFGAHDGAAPPLGWVEPVSNTTSTGGYIWPRYVSWYTGAHLYNYAVSGAVCSNNITPRAWDTIQAPFPSVLEYEVPAFIADKAYIYPSNNTPALNVPAGKTVYAMWIGTNDLGNNAFLTDSQVKGKTLVDYVDCIYDSFQKLYEAGARYFVLMNVIPLNLAPQYALPEDGGVKVDKFFKDKPANLTAVSYKMMEQVVAVNDVFKYRTPFEILVAKRYPGAHFAIFDVWNLFEKMYSNPTQYLNGTQPPNVMSWINQCADLTGQNCTARASPDSYLWYDELHPSEQADRIVAQEFVKVVKGESQYATYW